ncbi:hypothetical protein K5549_014384 [Capra hircus]|nr:hypothetical protein K5549_014384 [Capra hircus]
MADSGCPWAPSCWSACTDFSLTRKGSLLFAENVLCLVILICFHMAFAAIFAVYMCDLHTKMQIINRPWSAIILYLITSIRGNNSKITAGVLSLCSTGLSNFHFHLLQQRHIAAPTDPADGWI